MANSPTADQEFLEYLVKSLVDHPEDVKVDRKVDEMGVLLSLHVNAADMGQVVGRQGATAKAIRSPLKDRWRQKQCPRELKDRGTGRQYARAPAGVVAKRLTRGRTADVEQ